MASDRFINISLVGDKKLQKTLKKLALKDQKKLVRSELRKAAKPILRDTIANAPKTAESSGDLKKSIKLRAIKRSRNKIGVRIVAGAETGSEALKRLGYATYTEWGSKNQAAQKFMRKAVDRGRQKFDQDLAAGIGKALEREAKK